MQVAILLATYNGEQYLEELLDSVMNQSFQDFMCYIHDDGSTDDTVSIIRMYKEKYPDRVTILEYDSYSSSAKSNFLSMIEYVNEPYLMFCDQDDIWLRRKIEILYKAIKKCEDRKKEPIIVFSDMKVVNDNLEIINDSYMRYSGNDFKRLSFERVFHDNAAPGCTMIMNESVYKKALSYGKVSNIHMHDWWVMLIAALTGRIAFIDKPLALYRQHGENTFGAIQRPTILKKLYSIIESVITGKYSDYIYSWAEIRNKNATELKKLQLPMKRNDKRLCQIYSENPGNIPFYSALYFHNGIKRRLRL